MRNYFLSECDWTLVTPCSSTSSFTVRWQVVAINTFCIFKLQRQWFRCLCACSLWCLCHCTGWTSVALRQLLSCNKSCFQLTDSFLLFFCRQPVLQEVRTVPFLENHLSRCGRTEPASCNELYWQPAEKRGRLLTLHSVCLAWWFRNYLMGCVCCHLWSWLGQGPC